MQKLPIVLFLLSTVAAPALAQDYPTRPVRFIVTFVPGGGTDIVARMVGQKLTEMWNQQVIVDNRGGGGGVIGVQIAANAAPDGYTLLFGTSSGLVINPLLLGKVPYDPVNDFAPVTLLTTNPNMLVVNHAVPARSVKELVALAKASPRKLTYATAGAGSPSHLVMELFSSMTATSFVHVPYKGAGQGIIDLVSGQVQITFNPIPPLLPHVKSGKLKALGVSSTQRSPAVPDVPTVAESGVPGFEYVLWYSIFVPAKTPRPIIDKISRDVGKILAQPEVKQRLVAVGADPRSSTPEELGRFMREDTERIRKVIKAGNITAEKNF
jgi:tripartite-type tricarboxylate transporter receptor subunit TctC